MTRFLQYLIVIGIAVFICAGPLRLVRITSGSMEPALKTGSYCIVNRNYPIEKVKVGDIVVFSLLGGSKAAHRVVKVENNGFITKGDANETVDLFLVTKDNFFGKIIPWKKDC